MSVFLFLRAWAVTDGVRLYGILYTLNMYVMRVNSKYVCWFDTVMSSTHKADEREKIVCSPRCFTQVGSNNGKYVLAWIMWVRLASLPQRKSQYTKEAMGLEAKKARLWYNNVADMRSAEVVQC